jgi:hypothetical protein
MGSIVHEECQLGVAYLCGFGAGAVSDFGTAGTGVEEDRGMYLPLRDGRYGAEHVLSTSARDPGHTSACATNLASLAHDPE